MNRREGLFRKSRKGIAKEIRKNKRREAEVRNAVTPIERRSRKTNRWKIFMTKEDFK